MVSVGLFFAGSGWQEIVPSAIINGYLFCETLIGSSHYLIGVNVSNTATQITAITYSGPASAIGGYDWVHSAGIVVEGAYPSTFGLGAIIPSGTSVSVIGLYTPSVISGPAQGTGLYNTNAQFFNQVNISGATLSNVVVFYWLGADANTVYYFYISTVSLLASQNPVFITSLVVTSYLPLVNATLSASGGNNGGSAFSWNNSLFVLMVGGGIAPRGSAVLLATSGFQTFTSVFTFTSGLSVLSYNGFYGIQPAVTNSYLAIPVFDGTNVSLALTTVSTYPSFTLISIYSNPPNPSNELRVTAYGYGRYIVIGIGTRVGVSGSPFGWLGIYDTATNSLIPVITSISAFIHDPFILINPSTIIFPINAYNGTTSSSLLSLVFDSGISLIMSLPSSVTVGQATTVTVSTSPATSNLSVFLYEDDGCDYTPDLTDFGSAKLIGSALTNSSGVATFSYTPSTTGVKRLVALYYG
jgi:hypothetical protein